jgi:hypothetical protein
MSLKRKAKGPHRIIVGMASLPALANTAINGFCPFLSLIGSLSPLCVEVHISLLLLPYRL